MMPGEIISLYRYPVKGLSLEALDQIELTPGEGVPKDRLARSETRFDREQPEWLHKTNFLMLARDERLAELRTRFEGESGRLSIERDGGRVLNASVLEPEERGRIEAFFGDYLRDSLSAPPRLVTAPGHAFTDASQKPNSTTYKYVSLVYLASIRALGRGRASKPPLRFMMNIYFDGLPAWTELGWVGAEITVGGTRLRVVSPTTPCAATTVNAVTAKRDINVPKALKTAFDHIHMGVYAEVVSGGGLAPGETVSPSS